MSQYYLLSAFTQVMCWGCLVLGIVIAGVCFGMAFIKYGEEGQHVRK